MSRLAAATPRERLAALADGAAIDELDAVRPSTHLARFGIAAQADDGVVCARLAIAGTPVLAAAQDARFLGGSVGGNHGAKLAELFRRARVEGKPVLLLAASGGARLHEANAAEIALARALRELLDARAAGVPALALGVGDVFGGASVLACACERLALLPGTRLGLSGPKVIETARGRAELDAGDAAAVEALFGAPSRAAAGTAELLADDVDVVRAWFERAARETRSFADSVAARQTQLGARLAAGALAVERIMVPAIEDGGGQITLPAVRGAMSAEVTQAFDTALLGASPALREVVIVEDSTGHEVSRRAERLLLSQYLAHHAAVLALLRSRGVRTIGRLTGTGHSAAFFANALQADDVTATRNARVVTMEPAAIARVTRLDPAQLAALIEDDPLLGHPARHFVALGGARFED